MPPDHVAVDLALAGVPVVYLTPGLVWNTHASQTVWPDDTETGLISGIVCHSADELTVVVAVIPSSDDGAPVASE